MTRHARKLRPSAGQLERYGSAVPVDEDPRFVAQQGKLAELVHRSVLHLRAHHRTIALARLPK
jgi:hypothetical protein